MIPPVSGKRVDISAREAKRTKTVNVAPIKAMATPAESADFNAVPEP
jgi:hypothetical protein